MSDMKAITITEAAHAKPNQADPSMTHDLLKAEKLRPVIDGRYSLNQVAAAIAYLEEGHARGKPVIVVE
jgi:NADPH:quinone reductase-like Zn-dependent oxidoreductase